MAHREAVTATAEGMARALNKGSGMSVASPTAYSIMDESRFCRPCTYAKDNEPQELHTGSTWGLLLLADDGVFRF